MALVFPTPAAPVNPGGNILFEEFNAWMQSRTDLTASSAPFTVNARATALSMMYSNSGYIADQVMPRVPVQGEKFSWTQGRGETFMRDNTRVGRTGQANRSEFGEDLIEAKTEGFAWEVPVPKKDEDNAAVQGVRDRMDRANRQATNKIELDREIIVRDLVADPANYRTAITVAAGDKWDASTGQVLNQLNAAITAAFLPYTHLIIAYDKWLKLAMNPFLVQAYNGNEGGVGIVPMEWFEAVFKVKVVTGAAYVNLAGTDLPPGVQFDNLSRIWGKDAALVRLDETVTSEESSQTWGFTAEWKSRSVIEYFDPRMGVDGGTVVKVGEHRKEIVSSKWVGHLFVGAFA